MGGSAQGRDHLGVFDQDWPRLLEDVVALSTYAQEKHPGVPIFYLGHSMGSFILRALLVHPGYTRSGGIIMGTAQMPALVTEAGILLAKGVEGVCGPRHRNRLLSYLSTGRHKGAFGSPYAWLTRDKAIQKAYAQDPFCRFLPTTGMQKAIYQILHDVSKRKTIQRIPKETPLLVVSGSQDPVGNFGLGVLTFYRILIGSGHEEATLKLYPQARHDLLNDLCRDLVYDDILTWLEIQLGPFPR